MIGFPPVDSLTIHSGQVDNLSSLFEEIVHAPC